MLESASNLNESVADKRMSESFELELSLEFNIQPLLSSKDQAWRGCDLHLEVGPG